MAQFGSGGYAVFGSWARRGGAAQICAQGRVRLGRPGRRLRPLPGGHAPARRAAAHRRRPPAALARSLARVVDPPVRGYAGTLAGVLRDALGPALVGVYLHGSSALGDYHPSRSDIDILAVCAAALGAGERARLGAGLGRDALPRGRRARVQPRHPGRGPRPGPRALVRAARLGRPRPGAPRTGAGATRTCPCTSPSSARSGWRSTGRRRPASCARCRAMSSSGSWATSSTGRSHTRAGARRS